MRFGLIGTAAVLAALAAATSASAATYTVDPVNGSSSCASNVCNSLTAAEAASNFTPESDVIRIKPKAGGYTESGVSFSDAGIKLMADGATAPLIVGSGSTPAIELTGGGTKTIERLQVRAGAGVPAAVHVTWAVPSSASTLNIDSAVLSGNGSNPALRASRTVVGAEDLTVRVRHSTIGDAAATPAPATATDNPSGGTTAIRLVASLVQGSTSGATVESGTISPASLFVDPTNEDFHLRADASAAIDKGGGGEAGEANQDVDGTLRPTDWDLGADEFVNAAPDPPSISASTTSAQTGQTVSFSASGGADPNPGGSVVKWEWSFGDGTTGEGASVQHAYAAAGTYEVRASAIDNNGARSGDSAPITVTVTVPPATSNGPPPPPITTSGGSVQALASGGLTMAQLAGAPDAAPPAVAAIFPRRGQSVKVGRRAPVLIGIASDEVGVHRVELALSRRVGARCQWFDGRRGFRTGSCAAPRFFRAIVDDFGWRYRFPRAVRPRPGSYELRVRAFDLRGNGATSAALPFRFARG